jgi:hypothetical protein
MIFFASLKSLKKGVGFGVGIPELDPDPLFRGSDPRIRIRTKISRISNTAFQLLVIPVLLYTVLF